MAGLLIKFRLPDTPIGLLVMAEVFYAIGGSILVQIESVAVMAAVPQRDIATALALLSMFNCLGGAVGQAISGAIWTNIVPRQLASYLPEDKKFSAGIIFDSLKTQLSYPMGSPVRTATIAAYGDAQKIMVIVACAALTPNFLWVCLLKNIRLSHYGTTAGLQA
jgi:hypothetical protein